MKRTRARFDPLRGHMTPVSVKTMMQLAAVRKRANNFTGTHIGHNYTDREIRFALAMDAYKKAFRRPNPTCAEILAVLELVLGYTPPSSPEGQGRSDT